MIIDCDLAKEAAVAGFTVVRSSFLRGSLKDFSPPFALLQILMDSTNLSDMEGIALSICSGPFYKAEQSLTCCIRVKL